MNKQTNRESREDLFDHLIQLPVLRIFEEFYRTHKEVLLYLLFGGISFFLNVILFALIEHMFQISELINNVIGWVVCVLFQFVTNRTWVFAARTDGMSEFFRQMASFFGGRLLTLAVEELILAVFISWLQLNTMGVKVVAQIIVILLNYLLSKFWVFIK